MRNLLLAAITVATLGVYSQAQATPVNLVMNGNFSTGDYKGWTYTGKNTYVYGAPNDYWASFWGSSTAVGSISQTITDVSGQAYILTFEDAIGGSTGDQSAFWNGVLIGGAHANTEGGKYYSIDVVGTGTDVLTFSGWSSGGAALVSNVALDANTTAVPEPASMALFGASIFGLGMIRRHKAV